MKVLPTLLFVLFSHSAQAHGWRYLSNENMMTGAITKSFASVDSPMPANSNASVRATILVANAQGKGQSAIVYFDPAFPKCRITCRLLVRVDDLPPTEFPAKYIGGRLFLQEPDAFIDHVRQAARIRVQVELANTPQIKFTEPLVFSFHTAAPLELPQLRKGVGE